MPEWLNQAVAASDTYPSFPVILIRVFLAFCLGLTVAFIHRFTLGRKPDSGTLPTTLVLLSVLIAVIAMVIGDNVARAFGLVGALSIVRFRTVVEDTRDTAFVIFAVSVGMAAGAGYLLLALIAVPSVGLAAWFMCWWKDNPLFSHKSSPATLHLRIGLGKTPEQTLEPVLEKYASGIRLMETSTARQGSALDLTYRLMLHSSRSLFQVVTELNQIEGIDSAELKLE